MEMGVMQDSITIGLIPSSSMAIASLLLICLQKIEISKSIESFSQSLCAGLILAAVAAELFPILIIEQAEELTKVWFLTSISLGFILGITFLYGISAVVGHIQSDNDHDSITQSDIDSASNLEEKSIRLIDLAHKGEHNLTYQSLSGSDSPVSAETRDWEEDDVVIATEAIASPGHRAKIRESVIDVNNSIRSIDQKMGQIFSIENKSVLSTFREELTEDVDREVHLLQYKIDRCRRLLEGCGAPMPSSSSSVLNGNTNHSMWLSDVNKKRVHRNMTILKILSGRVIEDLDSHPNINTFVLQEIHGRVQNIDSLLTKLHNKVNNASYRWRKRCIATAPIPAMGSLIPMSLVIPVVIDAMVDGFLIGLSSAISLKVGYILAFANAIEMGFLGMAVSIRIRKCTGSHVFFRYLSLITPPLVMLLFTMIGMTSGSVASDYAVLFTSFVAFGVVALICLACNELLWEARQTLGGEDSWQSTAVLFIGVFVIIALDKLQETD